MKKKVLLLMSMVVVLMFGAVGCGKSGKHVDADGSYEITLYQVDDSDLTSTVSRNANVRIQGDYCEIGGEPIYDVTIDGSKVTMDNGYKKYTGTYDKKSKSFSLQGIDKDDNSNLYIDFQFERNLNDDDRHRIEKSLEHKAKRES